MNFYWPQLTPLSTTTTIRSNATTITTTTSKKLDLHCLNPWGSIMDKIVGHTEYVWNPQSVKLNVRQPQSLRQFNSMIKSMRKRRLDIIVGQTFFVVEMIRSGQTYLKVKKNSSQKSFKINKFWGQELFWSKNVEVKRCC